jgi:hypothetical protein
MKVAIFKNGYFPQENRKFLKKQQLLIKLKLSNFYYTVLQVVVFFTILAFFISCFEHFSDIINSAKFLIPKVAQFRNFGNLFFLFWFERKFGKTTQFRTFFNSTILAIPQFDKFFDSRVSVQQFSVFSNF